MKNQITIRQASLPDAVHIAEFNEKMALETERVELIPEVILAGVRRLIENETLGFYLVAEVGNKSATQIVGSLMVTTEWSDWRNGQFWWIQSVYVTAKWRRKGVYSRLYARVKQLAEQNHNVCGYRLYVENENTIAQSTYNHLGMHETHYKIYEEQTPHVPLPKVVKTCPHQGLPDQYPK